MDPIALMTRFAPEDRVQPNSPGFGYKLIMDPFNHRRYKEAMYAIAELHQRRRTHGAGGGLLITGPSGVGKSTILRAYLALFPRAHQAERTHVPVLLVTVPSSPTARSLAGAILEALGQQKAHRGTAPEKTVWIHDCWRRPKTEPLIAICRS